MRQLILPLTLLILGGCGEIQERARTAGGVAIQESINASVLALDAAKAYQCRMARIEALSLRFNTEELRKAWAQMCKSNPALPAFPETPETPGEITGTPEATFE